jgi:hypothetical protein
MRLRVLSAVGVALLLSACASGPPDRGPRGFGGDEEDEGGPPRQRAQLFLSPSGQPFRAGMDAPYPSAAWFAAADRDHDGRLTREEFRADAEAWFKTLDENGDGQVSMPETTRWEEVLVPEIARLAMSGFGGIGPGEGDRRLRRTALGRNELNTRLQGAAAFSMINEPHPIRGADTDVSMSVSPREWRAAADRRFALLDKDGDGAITLADLPRTPVQVAADAEREREKDRKGPPRRH